VYTPANIHIKIDNGLTELDINHDGSNDFRFTNFANECGAPRAGTIDCIATLKVAPAQPANRVVDIKGNIGYCAAALPNGVKVGTGGPFRLHSSGLTMAYENTGAGANYCPWRPVKLAYLGVKFVVSGKVHFGWVRIKRLSGGGFPATITGYAYETIPNRAIIAGKTKGTDDWDEENSASDTSPTSPILDNLQPTLGALALGAPGLSIWRRKETALQGN
jgi:hypothetical protein